MRPIITRDGVDLFYRDWGDGAPIVFLHGWTLASDMWCYQMAPLSERGLRCVSYDRRGHGRSADPGRGYDFDTLADDLATVLTSLDLRGVTLVGHSFASGEMVRYLTRHGPERIARLVFLGAAATPFIERTADNPDGINPALLEQFRQALLHDFPKWIDDSAPAYLGPLGSAGKIDWTRQMMLRCSMKAAVDCARVQTSTDFRPELADIRLATLVIHGDKDASAPLDLTGRRTAQIIPGAELRIYEGAGHGLYATHIDRLNADLQQFVFA